AGGNIEQPRITPGWTDESDADSGAIFTEPRGNSDGTHIEQIDKVGIETEPRIERHRVGEHFAYAIDGWRSRQDKHVDPVPDFFCGSHVGLQRIESAECLDGGDPFSRLYYGMHDRMDSAGAALEKW